MRDLSLHILDIVQNSVKAKAKNIEIRVVTDNKFLSITISDDGYGMDESMLNRVKDPFVTSRTTRRVGMGISLFESAAERAGGALSIDSEKGKGTVLCATFEIENIDRSPLGDLAFTVSSLIMSEPSIDYTVCLSSLKGEEKLDTKEIKETIGDLPISNLEVIDWIKSSLEEALKVIFSGILSEIDE